MRAGADEVMSATQAIDMWFNAPDNQVHKRPAAALQDAGDEGDEGEQVVLPKKKGQKKENEEHQTPLSRALQSLAAHGKQVNKLLTKVMKRKEEIKVTKLSKAAVEDFKTLTATGTALRTAIDKCLALGQTQEVNEVKGWLKLANKFMVTATNTLKTAKNM